MQTPAPNTPDASDAIFVYAGGGSFTAPAVGDFVEVVGTAGEAFGVTEIAPGARPRSPARRPRPSRSCR